MARADKVVMYTTNVLAFSCKVAVANFLLSMSSTFWVMGKASVVEYVLYLNSFSANRMFASEKVRKSISRTIFMLLLANKKVSSKN